MRKKTILKFITKTTPLVIVFLLSAQNLFASVADDRQELQELSRVTIQNFNDWLEVRKVIRSHKDKVISHGQKMASCLEALKVKFDEPLFLSCRAENLAFFHSLYRYPVTSTSLKFPKEDVTGGELRTKALALANELKRLVTVGENNAMRFKEIIDRMRENDLHNKGMASFFAAAASGQRMGYCTATGAQTISSLVVNSAMRASIGQFSGDIIDLNLAQVEMQAVVAKADEAVKYCGNLSEMEFREAKTQADQGAREIERLMGSETPEARLQKYCRKTAHLKSEDIAAICQAYCSAGKCVGPIPIEAMYSAHALLKNIVKKRANQ